VDTSEMFELFLEDIIGNNRAEKTIQNYHFSIDPFIEWLGDAPLYAQSVRSYKAHISKNGYKPSTRKTICTHIKAFVRWSAAQGYCEEFWISMPSVPLEDQPFLNDQQVETLLKACVKPRDIALILTMIETGVRRGELIELKWSDLDLENRRILIRRSKGKRARTVFVSERTIKALKRWHRKSQEDPVFQLASGGVLALFRRLSKRSGIYVRPHMLRRTAATLCVKAGMNPFHLQRILGHRDLQTTLYVKLVVDDLAEAHAEHGPLTLLKRA
jgi:integrase/recombinase XerD